MELIILWSLNHPSKKRSVSPKKSYTHHRRATYARAPSMLFLVCFPFLCDSWCGSTFVLGAVVDVSQPLNKRNRSNSTICTTQCRANTSNISINYQQMLQSIWKICFRQGQGEKKTNNDNKKPAYFNFKQVKLFYPNNAENKIKQIQRYHRINTFHMYHII